MAPDDKEHPAEERAGSPSYAPHDEWTEMSLERTDAAEEAKEDLEPQTIPTADPVFIHLIPWGVAEDAVDADSALVVQSGFASTEDDRVHRLSRIVLQLAVLNFVLSLSIELFALVQDLVDGMYISIVYFLFWVGFAYYVMWLGVQGVKTRNASCCDCCQDCGFLQAFQFIYVVFAFLRAVSLLVAVISTNVRDIVFNLLLLALTSTTAEYTRQLLTTIRLLPPSVRAAAANPSDLPVPLATVQNTEDDVEVAAEAQEESHVQP